MRKDNQSKSKPKKISWVDMLIYRLFRWRWNSILRSHPGMLKGLYDSLGSSLDVNYPGLREKQIDWQNKLSEEFASSKKHAELQLVVDNTGKHKEVAKPHQ